MTKRSSWLALSGALALAVATNGCATCGSEPDGEAVGESMGNAAEEEVLNDGMRDSEY